MPSRRTPKRRTTSSFDLYAQAMLDHWLGKKVVFEFERDDGYRSRSLVEAYFTPPADAPILARRSRDHEEPRPDHRQHPDPGHVDPIPPELRETEHRPRPAAGIALATRSLQGSRRGLVRPLAALARRPRGARACDGLGLGPGDLRTPR